METKNPDINYSTAIRELQAIVSNELSYPEEVDELGLIITMLRELRDDNTIMNEIKENK